MESTVDCSGEPRLLREKQAKMERESSLIPYQLKTPREHSDEEIEMIPLETLTFTATKLENA
jgi:hypothetical protein